MCAGDDLNFTSVTELECGGAVQELERATERFKYECGCELRLATDQEQTGCKLQTGGMPLIDEAGLVLEFAF